MSSSGNVRGGGTRVVAADADRALGLLVETLRAGGVAVVPTETVYGLMALPGGAGSGVERIYGLKGRPFTQRLPIAVSSLDQALGLGVRLDPEARRLVTRYWPGPLTIAVGFTADGPRPGWLGGRDEVALRAPDHQLVLDALDAVGPACLTSANAHGDPSPTTLDGALRSLSTVDAGCQPPDLAIDGGTLPGLASTLVNLNLEVPAVERFGPIQLALPSAAPDHERGG